MYLWEFLFIINNKIIRPHINFIDKHNNIVQIKVNFKIIQKL